MTLVPLGRAAGDPVPSPLVTAANCLLFTGMGATLSRSGVVALVAGALVLGRALGLGALAKRPLPPALGASVALAGLVPSMPASSPGRPAVAQASLFLCSEFGCQTVTDTENIQLVR